MQPLCKTVWKFLKKLKIELPCDPEIPLLSINLGKKKKKELAGTGIETPFFGSSNQLHVYPLIDSIKTSRYKQSIINVLI